MSIPTEKKRPGRPRLADDLVTLNTLAVRRYRAKPDVKARLAQHERDVHRLYPERRKARKIKYLYGLTMARFTGLLATQGAKCAICEMDISRRPYIDHEHSTGIVRGMLCALCNYALGGFRDNPHLMRRAADYVVQHAGALCPAVPKAV
jgi:hypothetical protein